MDNSFDNRVFGERLREEIVAPVTTREWADLLREIDQAEQEATGE